MFSVEYFDDKQPSQRRKQQQQQQQQQLTFGKTEDQKKEDFRAI